MVRGESEEAKVVEKLARAAVSELSLVDTAANWEATAARQVAIGVLQD